MNKLYLSFPHKISILNASLAEDECGIFDYKLGFVFHVDSEFRRKPQ